MKAQGVTCLTAMNYCELLWYTFVFVLLALGIIYSIGCVLNLFWNLTSKLSDVVRHKDLKVLAGDLTGCSK